MLFGIVLNAAVMGALSGPFDRFQARVIWLLPFAASVLLAKAVTANAASQGEESVAAQPANEKDADLALGAKALS